jgi:hypothetical protein
MKKLIVLLLCLFPLASLAQPVPGIDENALLKDYIGLTKLLKSNGIDPVNIRWNEIEAMCLSLQDATDPTVYNRCRYQKATDQFLFADDANTCNKEAGAIYPDGLSQTQQTITQPNGTTTTTSTTRPTSAVQDVRALRRYDYDHCMTEKGWRSSDNYQLGRSH